MTCPSDYAYGEYGNPELGIPKNAFLVISLTLLDFKAYQEENTEDDDEMEKIKKKGKKVGKVLKLGA